MSNEKADISNNRPSKTIDRRSLVTLCAGAACAALYGANPASAYAAKAKKPSRYDIVYVLNGGTQPKGQRLTLKAESLCSAHKLLAPKRRGYSFTGWFSDEDLEKPLDVLQGVKKASKRTAYAGWKKKTYTLTYVDNDAYETVRTKNYTVTTRSFEHEKPKRKGYSFKGWFLDEGLEEAAPSVNAKGSIGNKTLYAKWGMQSIWKEYLQEMVPKVKKKKGDVASSGESFVFLTDPHFRNNALCSLPAVRELMGKTKIKLLFMGGDILNADTTKEAALKRFQLWNKEMGSLNPYCIRGNHDNNSNNVSVYPNTDVHITDDELCQLVFAHLLGEDGQTCKQTIPDESTPVPGLASAAAYQEPPVTMETRGSASTIRFLKVARDQKAPVAGVELPYPRRELCYVVDNEAVKIRHIVLDTGSPDYVVIEDKQLLWMQRRILELPEGWTVIVLSHQFFCMRGFDKNGQQIMRALDAVYDMSNAVIAGVVSGHAHRDYAFRTKKGYVGVCTTCDAYKATSDTELAAGRATGLARQAFDVVHVDTAKRELYFQRIGYGSDRVFKY